MAALATLRPGVTEPSWFREPAATATVHDRFLCRAKGRGSVPPMPDDDFLAAVLRRQDQARVSYEVRLVLSVVLGLAAADSTRREPIRVSVQNDVVILAGRVTTGAARVTAGQIASSVPGVRDVCNALRPRGEVVPDEFDRVVAGLHPSVPRRRLPGPVTFGSIMLTWAAVPVTAGALGVSAAFTVVGAALFTALALRVGRR